MNRLIVIGASGHGKVVADIAELNGYSDLAFLDDAQGLVEVAGHPVAGPVSAFSDFIGCDFVVAIGNAEVRCRIQTRLECAGARVVSLVHPSAVVAKDVVVGVGSVVMAGAVINVSSILGKGCIVNTGASVDHDCVVGDYSHISVGAHLAGAVSIGKKTWVGIGAVVSNNVSICADCMIGAGAVVVKDILTAGSYVGVPAHMLKAVAY